MARGWKRWYDLDPVTLTLGKCTFTPMQHSKRRYSAFAPTSGCRDHCHGQGKKYETFISVASRLSNEGTLRGV
jgi:hypothetical protein